MTRLGVYILLGKEHDKAWTIQGVLSPCLFNLNAEYIMQNAWLDDTQAGIKIARRNISYVRYVDDSTLVTESEEPLAKGETGE